MVPLNYQRYRGLSAMKLGISRRKKLMRLNRRLATTRWGVLLSQAHFLTLRELSMQFELSVAMGDILLLEKLVVHLSYGTDTPSASQPLCRYSCQARSGIFRLFDTALGL
jgi:hypothetical protein